MPTLSWPASLPAPRRDGYGLKPVDQVTRTTMSSGRQRARRNGLGTPTGVTVNWVLSEDQMALFEAWYELDCQGGVQPFTVTLLGGLGNKPVTATFTGIYEAKLAGIHWQVTANLQIEQRPLLTREQLDFVTAHGITDINTAGSGLHRLIHHTLPREGW